MFIEHRIEESCVLLERTKMAIEKNEKMKTKKKIARVYPYQISNNILLKKKRYMYMYVNCLIKQRIVVMMRRNSSVSFFFFSFFLKTLRGRIANGRVGGRGSC